MTGGDADRGPGPEGPPDDAPRVSRGAVVRRSVHDRAAIRRRRQGVDSASLWIMAVAFLYAMVGLYNCAVVRSYVQTRLGRLSWRPADATVKIEGVETTVAAARLGLEFLELMTWGVAGTLVAILVALWWWSRHRPVPALAAALALFLALSLFELFVSDFEIDWLVLGVKIVCVIGLILGLKAALDDAKVRAAEPA